MSRLRSCELGARTWACGLPPLLESRGPRRRGWKGALRLQWSADDQRLLDSYICMKAALELCEVEVIRAREVYGAAEIMAIVDEVTHAAHV